MIHSLKILKPEAPKINNQLLNRYQNGDDKYIKHKDGSFTIPSSVLLKSLGAVIWCTLSDCLINTRYNGLRPFCNKTSTLCTATYVAFT